MHQNEKLQHVCVSLGLVQSVFRVLDECQQAVQEGHEEGGGTRAGGWLRACLEVAKGPMMGRTECGEEKEKRKMQKHAPLGQLYLLKHVA